MNNNINYNPDVLDALANLSSDEVFTPPKVVNQMLDTLPQEIWSDKNITFLDPATKSGVFLREIAKRLIDGLEDEIPDLQERLDHIYTKQLFGIAITELTSLLSRRSLYCTKHPDGEYSICTKFDNPDGNIVFNRIEHKWKNGKCKMCGARKKNYDREELLETHAYEFIHKSPKEVSKLFNNNEMKFDVIIGNPPYQLSDGGGGGGSSAMPLYDMFVEKSKKLNPRFLSMIIPSRWFSGGKGLDDFREGMLNDSRIRTLVDYIDSSACFPSVGIKGGVCYFLWDRDNEGKCFVKTVFEGKTSQAKRYLLEEGLSNEIFIRFNEAVSVLQKIQKHNEEPFSNIVSPRKPFGLSSNFKEFNDDYSEGDVLIYANKKTGWVKKNLITQKIELINKWKVFITFAYGAGEGFPHQILNNPILGKPNSCCTETYLSIGPFPSRQIAENVLKYIKTKFFRFLVLQIKNTQNATKRVYAFVPMQDFTQEWTDEKLYKKYNLNKEEIEFIESMIRPMD